MQLDNRSDEIRHVWPLSESPVRRVIRRIDKLLGVQVTSQSAKLDNIPYLYRRGDLEQALEVV
jgi:hypothetical protein